MKRVLLLVGFLLAAALLDCQPLAQAAEPGEPVEESMHEFMEYVFQPTYKRLKTQMAAEEKNNAAWKAVKSDSLILAESSNLLLLRLPKEDAKAWVLGGAHDPLPLACGFGSAGAFEIDAWPVSRRVNTTRAQDAGLIERVEPDRELFG